MRTHGGCIFRVYGEKKPLNGFSPIFFLVKGIHDVIKHAKFGDDRLRGSGVVASQISAFPIDFAGRPYNTLTLPCERVSQNQQLPVVPGQQLFEHSSQSECSPV